MKTLGIIRIILLASAGIPCVQGEFLLPSDATTGDIEATSADGRCTLRAKGPEDARLIVGGQFIGIQSSANTQNAAVDADGLFPADEYFELALAGETGLAELCVIWTRAEITISGFSSDPGLVVQGLAESSYDASTGTLTVQQAWTAGNTVCYTFLNPEASSGSTLEILPLDSNAANPALAIAGIQYANLNQQGPVATPDRYLQHFPQLLEARWPNNRTVNIIVYGDATSLGYNDENRPDFLNAYPHFLRGLLKERYPYAVINVIATGRYGLGSQEAANGFKMNVLDHQPDLLILDFGTEDSNGDHSLALNALSQMVQDAKDNALRVLLTTPPVQEQTEAGNAGDLAQGIRALAETFDVGIVDFFSVLNNLENSSDNLFTNGFLSREGHWQLAREIMDWFPGNPLTAIPSNAISSEWNQDPAEIKCTFYIEGMQGRSILLQRTHQLNRFWSTIDVMTPPSDAPTEVNLLIDKGKISPDYGALFFRLCLYN